MKSYIKGGEVGMIEEIRDKKHFEELKNKHKDFLIIIFYTQTSEKSKEALQILEEFKNDNKDIALYSVNASKVKDIHPLFREVDISRDERAAQELVRKSGQMAVSQTDIDGKIVVGFEKARLSSLLGINNEGR